MLSPSAGVKLHANVLLCTNPVPDTATVDRRPATAATGWDVSTVGVPRYTNRTPDDVLSTPLVDTSTATTADPEPCGGASHATWPDAPSPRTRATTNRVASPGAPPNRQCEMVDASAAGSKVTVTSAPPSAGPMAGLILTTDTTGV